MKFLFTLFLSIAALSLGAQVDSIVPAGVYKVDTVIVADTTYLIDTLIVQDTMLIKVWSLDDSEVDTVFLSSHEASWSLIPEEDLEATKDIVIRKDSGLFLVSAKISFADTYDDNDWEGYSISNLPPLAIQVEYFHDDLLSYGGHLLYGRNKYTNDTLSTSYVKNSVVGLAAIGTFHYGSWLQDVTHNWFKLGYLDLYASMALRFDVHRDVKEDYWNADLSEIENQNDVYVKMKLRPIFGARYYISDHFSINVELGRGNLGMLSSSVSWLISNP
ncbi:MAG: hypothetical protein PF444_08245 [Bacteroidales bacterium]|jgi:hypothetical protein|nr:hypothetical protein [Bacteroidales bacterium]